MKFKSLNIVLLPVIILFLQHSARTYAVVGKVGGCYSAIYSFGDSLADTGNLLAAAVAGGRNLSQLNFANLPYGETYFRNATGRYSDGRLIVDYIAQAFGLPFLEPYLRVRNTSKVAATGVNFAVAGATALKADFFKVRNIGPLLTPYSLDVQINWFLTQRRKICENYRGARSCQLQDSAVLHAQIWLKLAHLRRERFYLKIDLSAHSIRGKAIAGIIKANSAHHPIVCSVFSCLCPLLATFLCSRLVSAISGSLSVALAVGIVLPSFYSQAYSLDFARNLFVLYRLPSKDTCSSELPLCCLPMVHQRMRSHHGGSHGGRGRSQTAHSVDHPPPPATQPSYQANSPPLNPSRRPFTHNSF